MKLIDPANFWCLYYYYGNTLWDPIKYSEYFFLWAQATSMEINLFKFKNMSWEEAKERTFLFYCFIAQKMQVELHKGEHGNKYFKVQLLLPIPIE